MQNFFMPAEWAKHKATWMAWPYDEITFPDRIPAVERVFVDIIYHLHQNEAIELLVLDNEMQKHATCLLKKNNVDVNKVVFHVVDYADVWMRDYGPTFLVNKNTDERAWTKWQYNAYGEKFVELIQDDQVPNQLETYIALPKFSANIVMEGGAIEVNGAGVLLTTEQCLLNPNRNTNLDRIQTEKHLKEFTGASKVVWLKDGIFNDHTDGHIDEVARFVNANTIVVAYEENKNDPNFAILDVNWKILQNATDQNGRPFNLVKLPMPKMNYDDGEQAPVSYANFYIANETVLVPQFNHANDQVALDIIQSLFSGRTIVGIDCSDIIYGGGAIHCITQQQLK